MTIIERCVMRAPSLVVRGASVPRWAPGPGPGPGSPRPSVSEPAALYPQDDHINQRFAIWQGDITCLEVDAMTNTTDETMSECNAVSSRVQLAAGPGLKEEIVTKGLECPVGGVRVTGGHGLAARHVLHTACPDYSNQYSSAAEQQLYNCYKNVLMQASDLGAKMLSICMINTPRKNFPADVALHIALRCIRSHLERATRPQVVILVCPSVSAAGLAVSLAPAYFPRRAAVSLAPASEPHPERRIRIIHNPHEQRHHAEDTDSYCSDEAAVEAAAAFARACDTQRLLAPNDIYRPVTQHNDDHDQYERLLRRARSEDLSEVSGIGCLYQSGVDRLGRPVVIFIGKWFPIGEIDLDKALLYLIKLLDPLVRGDYVLVYFHTQASAGNHPPFSWLKEVYTVLPYKYKKNLKAFYIVHPTFWTKMMTWWFTTFMAPAIKAKVHTLPGLEYLYSVMTRDQLEVPAFVTEYDMTINGLHYFQPDATSTTT